MIRRKQAQRFFLLAAAAASTLLVDCRTTRESDSKIQSSGTAGYNGFVSLFSKVIGRKPRSGGDATTGDFSLYDVNQEAMVDKLLGSDQFVQDGFFNAHRDRLVLQLYQQSPQWVQGQHASFCALRKEMREAAVPVIGPSCLIPIAGCHCLRSCQAALLARRSEI